MDIKCITVIGLGLIGGSLAKALKERSSINEIIGIDDNEETINCALEEGIISLGSKDIIPQISNSDIVFICTPVADTLSWVKKLIPLVSEHCIITDVGSTKGYLINQLNKLPDAFHFIGGHPMAGSERSGYLASKSHLFENAYYILTPCDKSSQRDIEILTGLIQSFGSIPIQISASLHDKIVGAISHVPHIISAALVNMVQGLDSREQYMQKLAAGGFKDITRISSSNPEMWRSICLDNKDAILEILDTYLQILNAYRDDLYSMTDTNILNFFQKAKDFRDTFTSTVTGLIPGTFELAVDVMDKPGIIGEVSTLLGKHGINIKNLNISNSREYEGGVLIISLPDRESMIFSYEILMEHGYHAVKRH